MSVVRCKVGPWVAECLPDDGGRVTTLRFDGRDILTAAPANFRPPMANYGEYERRPVYGYDDCLPTMDACRHPELDWTVPDHGELCWLPWTVTQAGEALQCRAASRRLPLRFERRLEFAANRLTWHFSAMNDGNAAVNVQHVMHPLMPLDRVSGIELPTFGRAMDATQGAPLDASTPEAVARRLQALPKGAARMWLLQEVTDGLFHVELDGTMRLSVRYDHRMFSTLGIWWNRDGYPNEEGCRRNECAFEPIPGPNSNLSDAHAAGRALCVAAGGRCEWMVNWEVTCR
ncbi:MAG: hypothetical protein HQ523_02430 [Lentisphaerae bacterium]|nr:hypothetical protein [Lentisphaerota bacterium]